MRLERLLRLLPLGLVVLVLLNLGMMLVLDRQSRATFDQVRAAQTHRDALAGIREACEALTLQAVAWTLTRRTSQGRQYQEVKQACADSVTEARAAMPQARESLDDLERRVGSLASLLEAIQLEHSDETKLITVGRLEREVKPLNRAIHGSLDELTRSADQRADRLMRAALDQQQRTLLVGSLIGIVAIVVGVLLARLVTRRILSSVGEAVTVASALADGNLGVAPRVQRDDEIGQMLTAMDQARAAWISAIGDIHLVTQRIAAAAEEIADDAGTLNERSLHAASNLRQTARSMGELQSTVEASTASAQRAATLAGEATGTARDGSSAVSEVVQTMHGIGAESSKIGEFVSVIDAIAFQTNLLALNAAVEAARAGEQGRGFAVVAAEVRALAQRSATAAGEIRGVIGSSLERVSQGARSADGASGKIEALGGVIEQVSAMIADVSGTAGRQNREIDQLARAVEELDQLTQNNTRMVGSWTERAEQLRADVQRLAGLVRRFRLPAEAGPREPTAVAPSPRAHGRLPGPDA